MDHMSKRKVSFTLLPQKCPLLFTKQKYPLLYYHRRLVSYPFLRIQRQKEYSIFYLESTENFFVVDVVREYQSLDW